MEVTQRQVGAQLIRQNDKYHGVRERLEQTVKDL
jgi:hypothetical protein